MEMNLLPFIHRLFCMHHGIMRLVRSEVKTKKNKTIQIDVFECEDCGKKLRKPFVKRDHKGRF